MMDTIEFSKNIPPEKLAVIFKDYFEQHLAAYYMLKGVDFIDINSVDIDTASIRYSVKVLDADQKNTLVARLQSENTAINIYGKTVVPSIYLNGDLLCITISK